MGCAHACPCRNEPNVHLDEELPNRERWHGAELSVTILGNWQYYRAKVLRWDIVRAMQWTAPCLALHARDMPNF